MTIFTVRMKTFLLFITMIVATGCSNAQSKIDHIPPYHILSTDSVYLTPANLKKNTGVMIIYFSPDCGHCQRMMYELKPKLKSLGNIQIVMISFTREIKSLKEFYNNFGLSAYPNIAMGTEGYTYVVQRYYQIKTTPFIAIYNRQGHLVTTFEKAPEIADLIKAAKKA
jgi:thioredoxin-related protein